MRNQLGVPTSTQQSRHKKQMALFLLKLKEVRKVSQTAIDGLVSDFTLISQLQNDVSTCLQGNDLNFTNMNCWKCFLILLNSIHLHSLSQGSYKRRFIKTTLIFWSVAIGSLITILYPHNVATNKTRSREKDSSYFLVIMYTKFLSSNHFMLY